jgi:hypothetical protein
MAGVAGGSGGTSGATSSGGADAGVDCPPGQSDCDGTCIDTNEDVNHCGACNRKCSRAGTTGTVSCSTGLCEPTCTANRADCNKPSAPDADDGCDANLNTSASNCGSCGHTCYLGTCNGTCQPWKVVDAPDTSLPALLATDGTYVVWLDTGLTSIRQAKYDKTVVLTLSTDSTAFSAALSTFAPPMTLGGGILLVATESGVYEAALNTPSTASKRLALNTVAGAGLSALGIDPSGKHFGLAATMGSSPSQVYECQVVDSTCTAVGTSFTGGVYGAAANGSAYYFMNAQARSVQYFTFGSTTVKTLQANAEISGFLTLDSASAYWLGGTNELAILRGALTTGNTQETVSSFPLNANSFNDLATDGKNVYFSASGDSAYIGYAPVGGVKQTAKVLASTSTASSIAAASGKVFWIDGATIWAVAAP